LKLCVEQIHKAKGSNFTMGVFITDGILEDADDCIKYCYLLGRDVKDGKVPLIKLIMIGVGSEVDEEHYKFYDSSEETPLEDKIDLWSTSVVSDLKEESDIMDLLYTELMGEIIVAPTGRVESESGRILATEPKITDGMMGAFSFNLPKGENKFKIHVEGQVIEQDCSDAISQL
ncbi:MAG: hypothetical protein WBM27_02675, partial [bacterium]